MIIQEYLEERRLQRKKEREMMERAIQREKENIISLLREYGIKDKPITADGNNTINSNSVFTLMELKVNIISYDDRIWITINQPHNTTNDMWDKFYKIGDFTRKDAEEIFSFVYEYVTNKHA